MGEPRVRDSWDGIAKSVIDLPVSLPERVLLCGGVKKNCLEDRVCFSLDDKSLEVNATGEAKEFFEALSSDQPTSSDLLDYEAGSIVEMLAIESMVKADDSRIYPDVSGFSVVSLLGASTSQAVSDFPEIIELANYIAEGQAKKDLVLGWLLETFLYTSSAQYHTEPVIEIAQGEDRKQFWKEFMEDEREHWRIYRRLFQENGWQIDGLRSLEPLPATRAFIEGLRELSAANEVQYAAVLIFIERPPDHTEIDEDPLFSSLYNNYGFKKRSVLPMWGHALHNGNALHDRVGVRILSQIERLSQHEVEEILDANRRILSLLKDWHLEISDFYSFPDNIEKRFSQVLSLSSA